MPEWDKLLRQEKERRLKIIKNSTKCVRNTKIFLSLSKMNLFESNINHNNLNLTNKSVTKEDEEDYLVFAKNLIKENRDDKFKIKSRIEFEKLVNEPVCSFSTIKLRFSDNSILQGDFALQETVNSIYNFLFEHINLSNFNNKNDVKIESSYPKKHYNQLNNTLFNEKLYPNCLLYVNIDNCKVNQNFFSTESNKFIVNDV